ncbi:MAG TPA: helix-turn-helix transcriptional regulator [Solirubrobacterales bacterium]|nr:helix-turn-helix transcriptional regulator [Solirubrobacterales bacterium]
MSDLTEAFGERLIVARFNCGRITQETVAERAEVHRTQMTLYESGRRMPMLESLVRLAGAVDLTAGELLGPIRWMPAVRGEPGLFILTEDES